MIHKGETMIFCGYPSNHSPNVYRMFDLKTKGIVTTRDVKSLNILYSEWDQHNKHDTESEESDENEDEQTEGTLMEVLNNYETNTQKLNDVEDIISDNTNTNNIEETMNIEEIEDKNQKKKETHCGEIHKSFQHHHQ